MSLLDKIADLYPAPEWGFYREVSSATGAVEGKRRADAIAVNTFPSKGWEAVYFELKVSRGDLRRELRNPEKAKLTRFCTESFIVVPAPRKLVIPDLTELPRGWGLIEVGTGKPVTIVEAAKKVAAEPDMDFTRSLLRAGATQGAAALGEIAGAPMVAITRPDLSRGRVALACGHVAPMPLAKKLPAKIPCFACAEGRPVDLEVVEAMIDDAEDEDLARIAAMVERRMVSRGLPEAG